VIAALLVITAGLLPIIWWPYSSDPFGAPKIALLRFAVVAALAAAALRESAGRTPRLRRPSLVTGALVAWVLLNTLAFVASGNKHQSLYGEELQRHGVQLLAAGAATFVMARLVFTSAARMRLLLAVLAGSGAIVALHAIVQQAGADPWWTNVTFGRPPDGQVPVFSSLGHESALAAFLVAAAASAGALLSERRPAARMATAGGAALIVVAIGLTTNRGGYLALAAAILVTLAGRLPRSPAGRRRLVRLLAAVVALVLAVGALIAPIRDLAGRMWERTATILDAGDSGDVRLELWRVGVHITIDNPLLGTGQDTYPEVFTDYRDEVLDDETAEWFTRRRPESPHNLLVAVAAQTGLPALAALLLLIGGAMRTQILAVRAATDPTVRASLSAVPAALTGLLVAAMFMNPEVTTTWTFWLLLGAGTGFAESHRRDGAV
jgi:O-antigen ligase